MALRLLHTSDWHLGQLFYEFDRTHEHEAFLKWLEVTIVKNEIDVLLICGDVFDVSSPSASSTRLFYGFLTSVTRALPNLQIVVVAGNHDSAARLEAPKDLLDAFNVTVIGLIPKKADRTIDYEKLLIPLTDKKAVRRAWCMAIPFLRQGDYPVIEGAAQPYSEGVTKLYQDAYAYALTQNAAGEAIVVTGHLHTLGAGSSDGDKSERQIGGIDFIPAVAFHEGIAYTALGHIHKAQKVGGKETIRYSGSPLPMSFSEINYKHQVLVVELEGEKMTSVLPLEIPVTVPLLRIPAQPKSIPEVELELNQLPEATDKRHLAPFLEVRVLLDGPEPALRQKIEELIKNKEVRLTRIDRCFGKSLSAGASEVKTPSELSTMKPLELMKGYFKKLYNTEAPEDLVTLFGEVTNELESKES